jgi:hypothetical protein
MAGFKFRYRLCGDPPTVQVLKSKDTETLTEGDMLNLETGEVDLAATGDTNLLGVCLGPTGAATDSTTDIRFIRDADAVYGITDANARVMGATLDIAGATGAQTVATSSNKEFVVAAQSLATEETLVRINVGKHHDNKAQ